MHMYVCVSIVEKNLMIKIFSSFPYFKPYCSLKLSIYNIHYLKFKLQKGAYIYIIW